MSDRSPIVVISRAGERFPMRFDGVQDLPPFGSQEQFMALVEIPGLAPQFGTTYGAVLAQRGYTVIESSEFPRGLVAAC